MGFVQEGDGTNTTTTSLEYTMECGGYILSLLTLSWFLYLVYIFSLGFDGDDEDADDNYFIITSILSLLFLLSSVVKKSEMVYCE